MMMTYIDDKCLDCYHMSVFCHISSFLHVDDGDGDGDDDNDYGVDDKCL